MNREWLAYELGKFTAAIYRAFEDKEIMEWLESKGYTALDLNSLQVELRRLAECFYK
jgi:hypothetical protein